MVEKKRIFQIIILFLILPTLDNFESYQTFQSVRCNRLIEW